MIFKDFFLILIEFPKTLQLPKETLTHFICKLSCDTFTYESFEEFLELLLPILSYSYLSFEAMRDLKSFWSCYFLFYPTSIWVLKLWEFGLRSMSFCFLFYLSSNLASLFVFSVYMFCSFLSIVLFLCLFVFKIKN